MNIQAERQKFLTELEQVRVRARDMEDEARRLHERAVYLTGVIHAYNTMLGGVPAEQPDHAGFWREIAACNRATRRRARKANGKAGEDAAHPVS